MAWKRDSCSGVSSISLIIRVAGKADTITWERSDVGVVYEQQHEQAGVEARQVQGARLMGAMKSPANGRDL